MVARFTVACDAKTSVDCDENVYMHDESRAEARMSAKKSGYVRRKVGGSYIDVCPHCAEDLP